MSDLVVQALLVRPRRGHDLLVQVVVALGALLDRVDHPGAVAACERPVLGHGHELVLLAGAHHLRARAVDHVRPQLGLDADHGAVLVIVLPFVMPT